LSSFWAACLLWTAFAAPTERAESLLLAWGSPFIHLNGRWDNTDTSWWTGTGFKIVASNLKSLSVHLGPLTTSPSTSVGVSVNYGTFNIVNLTAGANEIPLGALETTLFSQTVVRIAGQGWQDNNMQLDAVELNADAVPKLYIPSELNFQYIGDSLSAGQYCPEGVITAWDFLTAEYFKAEHNIMAQPGGCLTDIECWGNVHGLSYEYFKAEDTGYYNDVYHNYTTPWDFARDQPPSHIVIHIGANDASTTYNVPETSFLSTYETFFSELRELYPYQPFLIFTPWGWPSADGTVSYYYTDPSPYAQLVESRHAQGDLNVFLVNTTGWVDYADVYPTSQHPNPAGHAKIAGEFESWLEAWGLKAAEGWATPAY